MTRKNATLIGMLAVVLWSTMVGLVRSVTDVLGPTGGAAMIYSCASILLLFTLGFPKIKGFPRSYLLWGSLFFVTYEVCFVLAIGYSHSSAQTIEINIVNYLWPSLTILFSVVFNNQKSTALIIPGLILSLSGVFWVLSGKDSLDWSSILNNVSTNPIAYLLALLGAFLWSIYCVVTAKTADGKNGVTVFFILAAILLWIKYATEGGGVMVYNRDLIVQLAMSAFALGFGYAAWNVGILYGNVTVLAMASYFTPILSSLFSAIILQVTLPLSFWEGALMVCVGSFLSWYALRARC